MTQAERAARPEPFPQAAREALASGQMRANVLHATTTIRAKRAQAVAEVADWEELRDAGAAIKDHALLSLEPPPGRARGGGHRRAVVSSTGRGTPPRPTRS